MNRVDMLTHLVTTYDSWQKYMRLILHYLPETDAFSGGTTASMVLVLTKCILLISTQ